MSCRVMPDIQTKQLNLEALRSVDSNINGGLRTVQSFHNTRRPSRHLQDDPMSLFYDDASSFANMMLHTCIDVDD